MVIVHNSSIFNLSLSNTQYKAKFFQELAPIDFDSRLLDDGSNEETTTTP